VWGAEDGLATGVPGLKKVRIIDAGPSGFAAKRVSEAGTGREKGRLQFMTPNAWMCGAAA